MDAPLIDCPVIHNFIIILAHSWGWPTCILHRNFISGLINFGIYITYDELNSNKSLKKLYFKNAFMYYPSCASNRLVSRNEKQTIIIRKNRTIRKTFWLRPVRALRSGPDYFNFSFVCAYKTKLGFEVQFLVFNIVRKWCPYISGTMNGGRGQEGV